MEGICRRPGERRPDELLGWRPAVRHDRGGKRAVRVRAAAGTMTRTKTTKSAKATSLLHFVSFVTFVSFVCVVGAQSPAYKMPRTPDGQPDLQGFWSNATYTPLERPDNVSKEFYTPAEAVA